MASACKESVKDVSLTNTTLFEHNFPGPINGLLALDHLCIISDVIIQAEKLDVLIQVLNKFGMSKVVSVASWIEREIAERGRVSARIENTTMINR